MRLKSRAVTKGGDRTFAAICAKLLGAEQSSRPVGNRVGLELDSGRTQRRLFETLQLFERTGDLAAV